MQGHVTTAQCKGGPKTYYRYICGTYVKHGPGGVNTTCGSQHLDAPRVLGWLVRKLQETYMGPAREDFARQAKLDLAQAAKANGGDVERLQKRVTELDKEVGRLVKAIRTIDAAELVEELAIVRGERDRVKADLARMQKLTTPTDLDAEVREIADTLADLGEALDDAEPAVLREVLRQLVSRIVCEWEPYQTKRGNTRHRFKRGTVELRPLAGFSTCGYCEHLRGDEESQGTGAGDSGDYGTSGGSDL